ncbi:hypothetical protein JX266_010995 [Neoarthrinium moseri]|nr:hypothetical protein JX266_010995 [Neoarthrinium moseri]
MSPPRRRSARIASSSKTPKTASVPRLGSVIEGDESPTAHKQTSKDLDTIMSSPVPKPSTPASATPVKLPMSEMHPSRVHQTMAPPSSGLRLGFVDVNADPKARDRPSGITQTTPSKTPLGRPSPFTFRVARPSAGADAGKTDSGLSAEAQRMMEELREEAAKMRAQTATQRQKDAVAQLQEDMASQPEQAAEKSTDSSRKIAKARGKSGRFSAAHMREFKKMDSIANTPAVRAANLAALFSGRLSPAKPAIKRSQSKANLDEPEPVSRRPASARPVARSIEKPREQPESPAKRVRQRLEDDTSTQRPVSRDGSNIPRPKSSGNDTVRGGIPRSQTLTNLMTPTKASAAKTAAIKTPTVALVKSPSKPDLRCVAQSASKAGFSSLIRSPTRSDLPTLAKSPSKPNIGGSLKKSATAGNLSVPRGIASLTQTPGRFDRVKSILKRQFSASKPKSHLPQFAGTAPKTPGQTERAAAVVPLTTPSQKFGKHVEFTPDTKQATLTQNSPSPVKSILSRSRTTPKLPAPNYPSLNEVMSDQAVPEEISYPDLSAYGAEAENGVESKPVESLPESVPGTFTFRSDHTIRFDSISPKGFGGASGQASVRQVRPSVGPSARMPGAFPNVNDISSNKENKEPVVFTGIPHGMSNKKRNRAVWEDEEVKSGISHGISNKKRHRASSDGEDEVDEGAQRGAKKLRKNPPPAEGEALVAPRLANSSPIKKPSGIYGTPSPQKKKGISLSRLNMLARPKNRK